MYLRRLDASWHTSDLQIWLTIADMTHRAVSEICHIRGVEEAQQSRHMALLIMSLIISYPS